MLFINAHELIINGQKICKAKIKQKRTEAVLLMFFMKIDGKNLTKLKPIIYKKIMHHDQQNFSQECTDGCFSIQKLVNILIDHINRIREKNLRYFS